MSESTTVVAPIEKQRLAAFKKMPAALQEVAQDFEQKLGRGASGVIMIQYNMGSRIADVLSDVAKYGSGAVAQLAAYLPIPGSTQKSKETLLRNLKTFSDKFTKEYVQEWSVKPMADGRFLELSHWLQLMKVQEKKDQEKMLNRIMKQSLSANDLEKEIRAGIVKTSNSRQGGRKPKTPSSAIAGLQATFTMAQKLNNYVEVFDEKVAQAINDMDEDDVTEALAANLAKTVEVLGRTAEEAVEMKEKAEGCLDRVKEVLEAKAEAQENEEGEDSEEAEDEAPKKKAKAPKAAKASSNGVSKKAKKGKKTKVKVTAGAGDEESEDEGDEPE